MNPTQVAERLASRVDQVARHLLPNGKREGHEWRAGSTGGESGKSLGVHLTGEKAGVWSDFATGESGDLLDLWCIARNCDLRAALTEAKLWLGIADIESGFQPKRTAKAYKRPEKPRCAKIPEQSAVSRYLIEERKLLPETLAQFKIAADGENIVFPFLRDGELIGWKKLSIHRDNGKKKITAAPEAEPCLFGWQALDPKARHVCITEGEIDAMTLHQCGLPALSVPSGGGIAGKQAWIETEWVRLDRFDEFVLCLDSDEQGQAAAADIAARLGPHRCRIAVFGPHKDANEALQKGATLDEFIGWIRKSRFINPQGLRGAAEFVDEVIREFYPPDNAVIGMSLPWKKANWVKFRPAELTIWSGYSGHGKSQMLGHAMVAGMVDGETVCMASMELPARRLLHRIVRQAVGVAEPPRPAIHSALGWMGERLWLFDVTGTAKADDLLNVFRYAARRYRVSQFVVDSLAKCGIAEDDYSGQKALVEKLIDFAHEMNVHVHLVVHPRKGENENAPPGKMDVKGTGAITDMADNVLVCWRNKRKEGKRQDRPDNAAEETMREGGEADEDARIYVNKQRYDGTEGIIKLWFDPKSLQYLSDEHCRPVCYVESLR